MAMFKRGMDAGSSRLPEMAYCLSHSLRSSLASSWDVPEWEFRRDISGGGCDDLGNSK